MIKTFLKNWVVPPKWYDLYVIWRQNTINRNLFSRDETCTSPALRDLKDIHSGKRCFILATGPSINQQDLSLLENEISIAVSFFGYHKDIKRIRPLYHIAAPMHPPLNENSVLKYLKMFQTYSWDCNYILGTSSYEYSFDRVIKKYPELAPHRYFFINYEHNSGCLSEQNKNFPKVWDPFGRPFGILCSAFMAIFMASYMGFKDIYLLGCDYNYERDLEGKTNQHFYPDDQALEGRENLSVGVNAREKFYHSSYLLFHSYRMIREHLNALGQNIYNASPDSSLDMFPFVKFESLFRDRSQMN